MSESTSSLTVPKLIDVASVSARNAFHCLHGCNDELVYEIASSALEPVDQRDNTLLSNCNGETDRMQAMRLQTPHIHGNKSVNKRNVKNKLIHSAVTNATILDTI